MEKSTATVWLINSIYYVFLHFFFRRRGTKNQKNRIARTLCFSAFLLSLQFPVWISTKSYDFWSDIQSHELLLKIWSSTATFFLWVTLKLMERVLCFRFSKTEFLGLLHSVLLTELEERKKVFGKLHERNQNYLSLPLRFSLKCHRKIPLSRIALFWWCWNRVLRSSL